MMILKRKARMVLCLVLILSFFLPAYKENSAYGLVWLVLNEADGTTGLTLLDALVVIVPLLFIPLTAIVLLVRAWQRIPVRRIYVGLPLLFLLFSTGLLLATETNNVAGSKLAAVLRQMHSGFYLTLAASVLLLLTRNRRRRHRKSKASMEPELAV